MSCEVGFDPVDRRHAGDEGGCPDQVGPLNEFEASFLQFEPVAIERTVLVGNQHDPLQSVDFDEELELIDDTLLFQMGLRMAGKTGGPAREGDAVVARQAKPVLKEVVEVLSDTAV